MSDERTYSSFPTTHDEWRALIAQRVEVTLAAFAPRFSVRDEPTEQLDRNFDREDDERDHGLEDVGASKARGSGEEA